MERTQIWYVCMCSRQASLWRRTEWLGVLLGTQGGTAGHIDSADGSSELQAALMKQLTRVHDAVALIAATRVSFVVVVVGGGGVVAGGARLA